jgi:diadenosine tetraphosphate (Ap4A) HIT family hydrolase
MIYKKLKAFAIGFDYGVKHFQTIEDHHFHHLPGASWHDKATQTNYRKGISFARKYVQYRYETLTLSVLIFTTLLFMFTW